MVDEVSKEYGQFSATDVLKKRVIDFTFNLCIKACDKQDPISDDTYETGFIRGTRLAKSMLWKYTPVEIRDPIKKLYEELEKKFKEIDNSKMNESNKKLNKQILADQVSIQVLEFLLVVLQYSPLSTEYKEMEVFGDFQELIANIRREEPVKLFSGELKNAK